MRTRIALGTAVLAASLIVVIATSTTATHASERADGTPAHVVVPSRFHLTDFARSSVVSEQPSGLAPSAAFGARAVEFELLIAAWRAAHPLVIALPPAPTPPPAPAATAPPPPPVTDATNTTTPDWQCIRLHESGDRDNSPTAPGGAFGFLETTWLSLGYSGWPYQAPIQVQSQAALFLYNELGWQPWGTRFVCGL